jgi:Lipocalin-like domain
MDVSVRNPKGYFVYDNTGHVMIQIMKTPPSPPFASGNDEKPTAEEVKTAFTGYVAYFGTYTVDAAKNVVIHHVEGSLKPSFTGTDQPRPFILAGDHLVIGDGKTWRRVLERVK